MASFSRSVAASGDDALWIPSASNFTSTETFVSVGKPSGSSQAHFFCRILNVPIEPADTVDALVGRLRLSVEHLNTGTSARIFGVLDPDPAAPTSSAEAEALSLTTAFVDWDNISTGSGGTELTTPDLSAIAQELIEQPSWASGNAMIFVFRDNGSQNNRSRAFASFDHTTIVEPQFDFETTEASGTTPVTVDRVLSWDVQAAIAADRVLAWDVSSIVTADRELLWDVSTPVQTDRALLWDVSALVTADRQMLWDVESSLTAVTVDRTLLWDVVTRVTTDRELLWNVTAPTLTTPTDLVAVAVSASQVDLTWTDTNDSETGYEIERSLDGSTGWTLIETVNADVVSYSDIELLAQTSYFYRVRARRDFPTAALGEAVLGEAVLGEA